MGRLNLNVITLSIGLAFSSGAMAQTMSKDKYKAASNRIAAQYKSETAACASFTDNAKDICKAGANGKQTVANAELESLYKPSDAASHKVRLARADAKLAVAKEKCDDAAGDAKDVCMKEAIASALTARANATAHMKRALAHEAANRKSTMAQNAANETVAAAQTKADEKAVNARKNAAAEKRDADHAVAKEKCDALAGDAKGSCIKDAAARFGKS